MAAFPDSVKSFTTKNTGDVVQAAHINDLQDEVSAIEGGVLNGTGRINSSHSTHAALSVTGGSTLGTLQAGASTHTSLVVSGGSTLGTLQGGASTVTSLSVSGNSTLAGSLQAAGSTFSVRPVTPPPHAVVAFLESTVTIGSSGASTVSWTAQSVLTNSSMHSTTTTPERVTPQSTGLYAITAQITCSSNSTGYRQVTLTDSSNTLLAGQLVPASTVVGMRVNVSAFKRFDALGGYVTCQFVSAGQSTLSLSSGVGETWIALVKL